MSLNFETIKKSLIRLVLIELIVVIVFQVFLSPYLYVAQYLLLLVNFLLLLMMFLTMVSSHKRRIFTVQEVLGNEAHQAFEYGQVGVLTYNEDYQITWVSEFFEDDLVGENIKYKFPKAMDLFSGKDPVRFDYGKQVYQASKLNAEGILFFKDVSQLEMLEAENKNNRIVLATAHLDNYEETTQYEEEQKVAIIDSNIRQAVVNWADKHNMFVRRIRADRYLLVLSEAVFEKLEADRFSIVNEIRKEATKLDTNITLSLAFSRKSDNFKKLEDMSYRALEIAQGRGGDQVVINTDGEDMRYFGGTTEAVEKRSKVRVRVTAQNLGELMSQSDHIFIVGHKNMDFDCLGSALGLSAVSQIYKDSVFITLNENDIEPNLRAIFQKDRDQLSKSHQFIGHDKALELFTEKSLLIMTDHHSLGQTQFEDLVKIAKKVVIIDHHRRSGELNFKPELMYIESSASSASELVVELFPYHRKNVRMTRLDATYMYTGMLIDTNRFRTRSGNRTFQAAAELRNYGADLGLSEDMLRDVFDTFELKNRVLNTAKMYQNYVVAAYDEESIERVLMSRVADEILSVKDVEASFVVAYLDDDTIGISARSKGNLNVQSVMERMGGGGHFTGAATIIKGRSIFEVVDTLNETIEAVEKEQKS